MKVNEKYGQSGLFFHITYGYKITAVVSSPEVVKKLLFHPNLADKANEYYAGFLDYLRGPFSILSSENNWKIMKKEYNTFLKRSCIDNNYYNTFLKSADIMVDRILEPSPDLHALTLGLTQDVAMRTLFGIETDLVYDKEATNIMTKMIDTAGILAANTNIARAMSPILKPLVPILCRKAIGIRKLVLKKINDVLVLKKEPHSETLMLQIGSRILKLNEGEESIVAELQEMFFTSAHTTGTTLLNIVILLGVLPDMQDRIWKEQYEIFGNEKRDPTMDDLKKMEFLDRFVKECLRFLGPPYSARIATSDINIDGITIPRGTIVLYLLKYLRMHPKYWKNPQIFDPDRFLEESGDLKYSYGPFGIGLRTCPGPYFATTLIKITLSKLLRRCKLTSADKDFRFENIKYTSSLLTDVDNPPKILVEERT